MLPLFYFPVQYFNYNYEQGGSFVDFNILKGCHAYSIKDYSEFLLLQLLVRSQSCSAHVVIGFQKAWKTSEHLAPQAEGKTKKEEKID